MKGSALKSTIIATAIFLVGVVVAVLYNNSTSQGPLSVPSDSTDLVVPVSPTIKTTPVTKIVQSPIKIKAATQTTIVKTAPIPTIPKASTQSYADYQTQLKNNQNQCLNSATTQYRSLYSTLESSSFESYYAESTGACYMKVTGKTHAAYSSQYVGHIYFRNVSHTSLIAECTDPTGVMVGDANWACTDKTTGQSMNIAAFSALTTNYLK